MQCFLILPPKGCKTHYLPGSALGVRTQPGGGESLEGNLPRATGWEGIVPWGTTFHLTIVTTVTMLLLGDVGFDDEMQCCVRCAAAAATALEE